MIYNKYVQSLGDSFTADVYDELLTQAEIQGYVNSVNGMLRISSGVVLLIYTHFSDESLGDCAPCCPKVGRTSSLYCFESCSFRSKGNFLNGSIFVL